MPRQMPSSAVRRRLDSIFGALVAASLALFALPSAVFGQPVNAEVLTTNLFEDHWSGNIDGSLALARGNVNLLDVGGGARVQYQTLYPSPAVEPEEPAAPPFLRQRVFLRASTRFAEQNDSNIINQGFVHLRWSAMWHRRVGSDLFSQHQFNQFFRLRVRSLLGAGLRLAMVHEPRFLLWGGSGYMFERERIDVQEGATDAPRSTAHRWATFCTARLVLAEGRFLVQNTIFFQPRFDAFADYRLLEELEAMAKLTDLL
ncbi:MAG: hypothetical protein H5U40_12875, partial [Polyangiaceae bacterium]|nr:hypothetical protein [Polyangiaceae bacterium]